MLGERRRDVSANISGQFSAGGEHFGFMLQLLLVLPNFLTHTQANFSSVVHFLDAQKSHTLREL